MNYLCIGHVCHDIIEDDFVLGGTASYASIVAQKLGMNTSILTSYGADFQFEEYLKSFDIHLDVIPSETTTTFENIYEGRERIQYMHECASQINTPISFTQWHRQDIIHLCLIANEIGDGLCQHLPSSSLVGLALQGAIRDTLENKKVISKLTDLSKFKGVDIAFYSYDDIAGLDGIEELLLEVIPILVKTENDYGATIRTKEGSFFYPSYPSKEVDPTGAGDVFGAAFLIAYHESKDLKDSCAFAHAAASLSIEGIGVRSIPSMKEVKARQSDYLSKLT